MKVMKNPLVGFLVNPIAGMGGSVGLKGTDGNLYEEALRRGAKPVSPGRALRFVRYAELLKVSLNFLVAAGVMGCKYFEGSSLNFRCLGYPRKSRTTPEDTKVVAREFQNMGVDLIVFVGGDGTARDVLSAVGMNVPLVGIPSGVKMYSGVFAASPESAALIVKTLEEGKLELTEAEVADVDEYSLSEGTLRIRGFGKALTFKSNLIVPTKDFTSSEAPELEEIAEYFVNELMEEDYVYLLGPGSTVKAITDLMGLPKTLLGFDALYRGELIALDLDEEGILELIRGYGRSRVYAVLTVIGRQGYLLGRGNQQLSPRVLRLLGKERLIVLATPSKLRNIKYILVDTGDPKLDESFEGYIRVITGYREETVVKVVPAFKVA